MRGARISVHSGQTSKGLRKLIRLWMIHGSSKGVARLTSHKASKLINSLSIVEIIKIMRVLRTLCSRI
jgi:hypothetical protein